MTKFPIKTLGEICREGGGFVKTGPFGSQLHRSDYTDDPDGIPVVMPKDMIRGRIDRTSIARIDQPTAQALSQHLLAANDVVLSRRGDVGRSAWVFEDDLPAFCGTGSMRVHLGEPTDVRPEFLRFFFHTKLASNYLEGHAVGATMPNLNSGIVQGLPVPIPPMAIQDSLIEVLESFDELIENNRRRVEVLEEMARACYREWFVKFRYPGHENVPLVDSALGSIPEGWVPGVVDNLVTIVKAGVDPSTIDPATPAVGLEHIPRQQITLDDWGSAANQGSRKGVFVKGDILFGKIRPYFHKVSVAPVDGICSTDAIVIRASEPHWGQVVAVVSSTDFVAHATGTSNGTKMPRADWKVIGQWPIAFPPTPVAEEFTGLVRDQLAMAEALMFENRKLAGLRDLLLPKLVIGQIDVSTLDLDALVEEQVAS